MYKIDHIKRQLRGLELNQKNDEGPHIFGLLVGNSDST